MIRCARLSARPDGASHFTTGRLDLAIEGGASSVEFAVTSASVVETGPGGSLKWHPAPRRQLVITLTGTPTLTTPDGESITQGPGDVTLAEDTTGPGHRWHLDDTSEPWRRLYVVLADQSEAPFLADADPTQRRTPEVQPEAPPASAP